MLTIRRAELNDRDAIISVHIASVRAIRSHYTSEELESWAKPKEPQSYDDAIRTKQCYVASVNNVIVGFGVLNQLRSEIEAVYVSPDGKGQGTGMKIISALEKKALELGLRKLTLNASLNAVDFYKRAGFEALEEGKYRLNSGLEIRCMPMVKTIQP